MDSSIDAPDPKDDFEALMEGVELEEPTGVTDYSVMNRNELLDNYHSLTAQLLALGETIAPETDEGREIHSRRVAAVVELRNRGIL